MLEWGVRWTYKKDGKVEEEAFKSRGDAQEALTDFRNNFLSAQEFTKSAELIHRSVGAWFPQQGDMRMPFDSYPGES